MASTRSSTRSTGASTWPRLQSRAWAGSSTLRFRSSIACARRGCIRHAKRGSNGSARSCSSRCRARSCSSIARWRGGSFAARRRAGLWAEPESAARRARAVARRSRRICSSPIAATPGCQGCYTGASPRRRAAASGASSSGSARSTRSPMRGVFHLALGGGETAVLPWLGELAEHARARGIVPNLTTSGPTTRPRRGCVAIAAASGRSTSRSTALGDDYAAVRGFDGFARADRGVARAARGASTSRHQLRRHARTTSTA